LAAIQALPADQEDDHELYLLAFPRID